MAQRRYALINKVANAAASAWGTITGTLADQTDLQSALDAKAASSHTHVEADITDFGTDDETITGDWKFQPTTWTRFYDSAGNDYLQFDHDGTDFNMTGFQTTDINITGANVTLSGNYPLEGYATQRSVIRSMVLFLTPGTTPGTNFDIAVSSASSRDYNVESLTDATDLSTGTSSRSFAANTNSRVITCTTPVSAVGILSADVIICDAFSSAIRDLTVDAYVNSGNIRWSMNALSVTQNHATMLNTGDLIRIRITYVTNS